MGLFFLSSCSFNAALPLHLVQRVTVSGVKRELVCLIEAGMDADEDPHVGALANQARGAAIAGDSELVVWASRIAGALDDLSTESGLRQCWVALSRMKLTPDSDLSLLNDPQMPLKGLSQKYLGEATENLQYTRLVLLFQT